MDTLKLGMEALVNLQKTLEASIRDIKDSVDYQVGTSMAEFLDSQDIKGIIREEIESQEKKITGAHFDYLLKRQNKLNDTIKKMVEDNFKEEVYELVSMSMRRYEILHRKFKL